MKYVLLLFIFINLLRFQDRLFTQYPLEYWLTSFPKSQIVIGDKAPYFFSDSELYAIVGYKYIHGDIPTNLHPEVPPLGKILIGTSLFLFQNQNIMPLLFALSNLLLLYIIGRRIGLPKKWTYLALILLVLDYQFWDMATSSMLDIFLLTFLLTVFLSFNNRWFWLTSLFLGFMAATKLYYTAVLALGVLILATVASGSFKIFIHFIYSLPVFAIGLSAPYANSFFHGTSPIEFIKFQRWLTVWWAGNSKVPFGGIFPLVFQNQWHTWWGTKAIISVPHWNVFWPFSAFIAYLSPLLISSRKNILLLIIELWIFGYLAFLSITSPFPRYLILLFPFWVLLALKLIYEATIRFGHFGRST